MYSKKSIKELETAIETHQDYYYNQVPLITDTEFDDLVNELRERDPNSSILDKVGAPVPTTRKKIKHTIPVGSIDSVKSNDEIIKKFQDNEIVLTPKLDGLTVVLYYKDGKLVKAATRGDGKEGLDIMHHVPYIKSINTKFSIDLTCIVRGEAVLFNDDHKFLGYANRRNGASGILNHKKSSISKTGKIQFMPFEIFTGKNLNKVNRLKLLHSIFPLKLPFEIVDKTELVNISTKIESFISENVADPTQEFGSSIDFITNKKMKYSIDGLIISQINSLSGQGDLAWKLFDKVAYKVAEVKYVEWNLTRTGNLFPRIVIEPIELDGVTIQKITGESADFIIDNEIGTEALVEVIRANGVIPKVQKVISKGICEVPIECPHCGSKIKKKGAFIFCSKPKKCDYVLYKKLVHSLLSLKIDGLQETTIQTLISAKFDGKPPTLTAFVDKILGESLTNIDGIGTKKSNQIKQNLSTILHETDIVKILQSTGIPGLGERQAEALLTKFSTIRNVFRERNNKEAFLSIEMIGEKVYKNLQIGLNDTEEIFIELFQNSINIPYGKSITEIDKMKNFVLTGKFEKKRTEMAKIIEEKYGWKFVKSLSKKVDFLIVGENPGSKIKKAKKMGIEIIEGKDL